MQKRSQEHKDNPSLLICTNQNSVDCLAMDPRSYCKGRVINWHQVHIWSAGVSMAPTMKAGHAPTLLAKRLKGFHFFFVHCFRGHSGFILNRFHLGKEWLTQLVVHNTDPTSFSFHKDLHGFGLVLL